MEMMNMGQDNNNSTMMKNSFYWGSEAIVLFSGWPDRSPRMYALAIFFVFLTAVIVELLYVPAGVKKAARTVPTVTALSHSCIYAIRVGLSYLVMLSVMSFNAGIFIAAVVGHAVGFFAVKVNGLKKGYYQEEDDDV